MISKQRREALLSEYREVVQNFRTLTDIRFKLLGLLPIATALGTFLTFKGENIGAGTFVLSLFGLIVTVGVLTYNERNNQLYDELVGRAAAIERCLGLPDGAFANRPRAWLSIGLAKHRWKIDHRQGISAVYLASIILWLTGAFASVVVPLNRAYLNTPILPYGNHLTWETGISFLLAAMVAFVAKYFVKTQTKKREKNLRIQAHCAVNEARRLGFCSALTNDDFLNMCLKLIDPSDEIEKSKTMLNIKGVLHFIYTRNGANCICRMIQRNQRQLIW